MPEVFLKADVLVVSKFASRDWPQKGYNRVALVSTAPSRRHWRNSTAGGWCSHAETVTHANRHKPARRCSQLSELGDSRCLRRESKVGFKLQYVRGVCADRKRELHTRAAADDCVHHMPFTWPRREIRIVATWLRCPSRQFC